MKSIVLLLKIQSFFVLKFFHKILSFFSQFNTLDYARFFYKKLEKNQ